MDTGGSFKKLRVAEVYEIREDVNREKGRIFQEYGFKVDHWLTYGDIWLVLEIASQHLVKKRESLSRK